MTAIEELCRQSIIISNGVKSDLQFKADYFTALCEFNATHTSQIYSLDYAINWMTRYLVKHYEYQPKPMNKDENKQK